MKKRYFSRLSAIAFLLMAFTLLSTEPISAQSKKDKKRAEQLVKDGDKAYSQRNFRLAVDSFSEAAKIVPINAQAHYKKGLAHHFLQENDQAVPELDQALSKGYRALDVYKARWKMNHDRKNYDAAAEDIKQVLQAEPNNDEFVLALADINYGKGLYKDAVGGYEKVLLKAPGNGDLYYKLARSRSQLGDADGQAVAAEEAVKKNTLYLAESFKLLGDARARQKRVPEAIDAYERALRAKPGVYEAYKHLAELYLSENRIDDAIEILKAGLRQFPGDGKIYADISWYYSLAGRTDDAVEAGRAATRVLPNEATGYTNLCRAYNDTNKPEMAVNACNTALRLSPEDGETNFYMGRAHAIMRKQAEAEKYYKRAVTGLLEDTRKNSDNSTGFYLLGNAYAADGQSAEALQAYKKCLELNPRFAKAQFNIGIIQIGQKNKSAAMEQYNSLLATDKVLAGKLKQEIDKLL